MQHDQDEYEEDEAAMEDVEEVHENRFTTESREEGNRQAQVEYRGQGFQNDEQSERLDTNQDKIHI